MTNYDIEIYEFLSQFTKVVRGELPSGLKYDEYILLRTIENDFGEQFNQSFSIYTHNTTSFARIKAIKDNIKNTIKNGIIYKDLFICLGSPFYQDRPDEEENTKSGYVNLLITIY